MSSRSSPFIVDAAPSRTSSARHNILTFDQTFARASARNPSPAPPQYRSAQPNDSNHYSLSRWANENSREAPWSPRPSQPSYSQRRYESESSREQPWNAVRFVPHVVSVEPRRESRPANSSTRRSVTYYDPRDGQLGGRTGVIYRTR